MNERDFGERGATQRAVALRYDRTQDRAPLVVAAAHGELANRMLELARERGIPVRQDPDLLELLSACDVGLEVPVELYTVVAELLAGLYRLNEEMAGRTPAARSQTQ